MVWQRREDIDYLTAVARVRVLETRLIKAQELDRLLETADTAEAWRMVRELWELPERPLEEFELVLGDHLANLYAYVAGFLPDDGVMRWLGMRNDYHNLKVLLKEEWLGETADPGAFSLLGTVTVDRLRQELAGLEAPRSGEHHPEVPAPWQVRLRDAYGRAVLEAQAAYQATQDPQVIDVVLDRHQLMDARDTAGFLGEEVQSLADLWAELANLKILLRANKLGKSLDFLRLALAQGGRLPQHRWEAGWNSASDEVAASVGSPHEEIIRRAGGDPGRVEREADNHVLAVLRQSRYHCMGAWPIVAFLWAKESDVRNVRILLSGKVNGASVEAIRERLRDTYV